MSGEIRKLQMVNVVPIEATDTDTAGYYDFLVAELCGGVMEDPELHYENYQIIHADTSEQAEKKYNKINDCNYYYAKVIGVVNMYGMVVPVSVSSSEYIFQF